MVFFVEKVKMARIQNIKSEELTYSSRGNASCNIRRVRTNERRRYMGGNGIPNAIAIGTGTSFTAFDLNLDREASLSLPFIGFDFRLNNTGRSDTSGREQPVNNVKRVLRATFSADFYGFNPRVIPVYHFGCIPNAEFEIDKSGDFKTSGPRLCT